MAKAFFLTKSVFYLTALWIISGIIVGTYTAVFVLGLIQTHFWQTMIFVMPINITYIICIVLRAYIMGYTGPSDK